MKDSSWFLLASIILLSFEHEGGGIVCAALSLWMQIAGHKKDDL